MSPTSKLIFGRLCQYAGEDGQSYPTYSTLGREVNVERRQAIRAVKELEKFGLILSNGRFRLDGGSTSNIYIFLWHGILCEGGAAYWGEVRELKGEGMGFRPIADYLEKNRKVKTSVSYLVKLWKELESDV